MVLVYFTGIKNKRYMKTAHYILCLMHHLNGNSIFGRCDPGKIFFEKDGLEYVTHGEISMRIERVL